MSDLSRRSFFGVSAGALATLHGIGGAFAAACVTGPYPTFLPNRLTVDCASKKNFQLFRQNTEYMGLAGAVSMTAVRGKLGTYEAGNMFLFPWLKPKGLALGTAKVWPALAPTSATAVVQASPIRGAAFPQDEALCTTVLQAPTNMFIGFAADVPFNALEAKLGLYTNIAKLGDGKPIGVDWASSNLNLPWFGGPRAIPNNNTCYGAIWRRLILDGLNQASVGSC